MEKVSVLIMNYNYARFLGEAIESVLNQDYPGNLIEIIVVDDGSTDNTKEVIERYKDRIKYIYQKNRGQAEAINSGLKYVNSKYLFFLDADDFFYKNKISRVVEEFKKDEKIGLVRHLLEDVDVSGKKINNISNYDMFYKDEPYWIIKYSPYKTIGTSSIAVNVEYLKNILPIPPDLTLCPDEYITLAMAFNYKIFTLPYFLGTHRLHGSNYYNSELDLKKIEKRIVIREKIIEYLKEMIKKYEYLPDDVLFYHNLEKIKWHIVLLSYSGKKSSAVKFLFKNYRYLTFRYIFLFCLIILSYKLYENFKNIYFRFLKHQL